jgi:hypothetical protein
MNKIIYLISILSFSLSSYGSGQSWDLNDVSYLFPLPTASSDASFLKARDFIPFSWFTNDLASSNGYPFAIDSTQINNTSLRAFTALTKESFDRTRLLAVRIDPCFRDQFSDPCRMQVRAVWQPLDKKFNTVDATMHTFYDLNPEEFLSLTKALKDLKAKYQISTAALPLQVHPGFKQKDFTRDFFTLMKSYIQQDRLTRIAFMKLLGVGLQWRFQGFNVQQGKLLPIEIPIRKNVTQTFSVHRGTLTYGFLELSQEEHTRLSNGEQLDKVFMDYVLRVENPKLNLPGTTDCLSCHAGDGIKGPSALALGLDPIPTAASSIKLLGKYNLANTTRSREDLTHFRGFGYVDKNASISDRAIIESAMVADSLNMQNY